MSRDSLVSERRLKVLRSGGRLSLRGHHDEELVSRTVRGVQLPDS